MSAKRFLKSPPMTCSSHFGRGRMLSQPHCSPYNCLRGHMHQERLRTVQVIGGDFKNRLADICENDQGSQDNSWLRQHPSTSEVAGASLVTAGFEVPLLALSLCLNPRQWVPIRKGRDSSDIFFLCLVSHRIAVVTKTSKASRAAEIVVCVIGTHCLNGDSMGNQTEKEDIGRVAPFSKW
jgi:hypothetical protein